MVFAANEIALGRCARKRPAARFRSVIQIRDVVVEPRRPPHRNRGAALGLHDRACQRRALLRLSDDLLGDIGISRAEALKEAGKAFWRS